MSDDSSDDERERRKPKLIDDNAGLHPLFWDAMPEDAESVPEFQALKALDDDLTPDQKAENFKTQGNNKLRLALSDKADAAAKRTLLRESAQFYTDGLEVTGLQDSKLITALHANRAQVHLLLGNYRKALEDGTRAQALDPGHVKAIFRAARAAGKLGLWEQCVLLCGQGRAADPASKEFDAIEKEASGKLAERRAAEERIAAQREAEAAPARALVDALLSRGCRLTRPQLSLGTRNKAMLQADGSLVWPVLLMYGENMQQDVVEAFGEDDTFEEHLDMMFGPDAPPLEWDTAGEYTRDRIEVYYLAHAGTPLSRDQLVEAMQGRWPTGVADGKALGPEQYGSRAARMRRVNTKQTLRQVLAKEDHVIAGVPLFWVVAKGTAYREIFLDRTK